MFRRYALGLALAASLALAAAARAQDGTVRVGTCNPLKVLSAMDEWKALQDRMQADSVKLKGEDERRKAEINELVKQRNELKPETALYKTKSQQVLEKSLEYRVWLELQNMEIARMQKQQLNSLFDKILDSTKEVAESKKLDLVLAERRPDISEQQLEAIKPDDLMRALLQRDVLYSNEKPDITQAVILLLNKKYAAGGATKPAK